ncbi:biotin--[acetyl-CoA-carboxylase] ligase [bacterium]|nr:biotin--[acetyl-CoA-carboxylase] ligase [bacterium]
MNKTRLETLLIAPCIHLRKTESTNKYLLELPTNQIVNGMTCSATVQTKGRGRKSRIWKSPSGGLYLSVLIIPTVPQKLWHMISFVLACASAQVISEHYPDIRPLLKWPNDILVNGRKIAGILVQSITGKTPRVIAGIGINVTTNPIYLPARPIFPASVISQESGLPTSMNNLSQDIRKRFFRLYLDWIDDASSILKPWNSLCALKNTLITLSLGNTQVKGFYRGITSDGSFKIDCNNSVQEYRVGDIIQIEETER